MTAFVPGAYTALVTPFTPEASAVDWDAFERLLNAQVQAGVAGVVPCGTTGESPTLSEAEQRELLRRSLKVCSGKVRVVMGTGSNDTKKTILNSREAAEAGADGVMLVMPYYSRPSQEGLFRHVVAVAREVPVPVMLYNIPSRTGVELSVETLLRILDAAPNVVALKDATGNVLYTEELVQRAADRIVIFSGDDVMSLPLISVGASGVVSVTSNLYPREVSALIEEATSGNIAAARAKNVRLLPVHRAMFVEPNPQPIKAALSLRGAMNAAVRLPLVEASAETRARLTEVLGAYEAS
jgi:4-hydroxy-tetrahydrodipicolinate synthase